MRERAFAWASCPLAATLGAGFLNGEPAPAISDGNQVADGRYPFVARIDFGDSVRSCSVALIPRPDRNVVLAPLSGAVTGIAPVPLTRAAPAPGDALHVTAFGRTDTEWVPERMHAGIFTVESTGLPTGNDPL